MVLIHHAAQAVDAVAGLSSCACTKRLGSPRVARRGFEDGTPAPPAHGDGFFASANGL
jgi:hypothetical protein